MNLRGTLREFYTFGIYGRDFSLDGTGGSETLKITAILMVSGLTATFAKYVTV